MPPHSHPPPASSGPRRERNSAATKLRLLDAAEHEFAARGFTGVRLRDIADAAGVQSALIHHYFGDKQGLYRAVLDRVLLPTSTESWTLLGSGRDLDGLLDGFVEMLLRFHAAHHNLLAILRHEAVAGSDVLSEITCERTLPVISALRAVIIDAQARGQIRADIAPEEIIVAGMSMVAYPFLESRMLEIAMPSVVVSDDDALARRKRAIITILLQGVRPR
jgi:TetR/AcrR family transcriptional regulator